MENMIPKFKSPEELFLEKLKLTPGTKIKLIKRGILTTSDIPVGTEIEGTLKNEVRLGKPIYFNDTNQTISNISAVGKKDSGIFLKTNTSIYELVVTPETVEVKTLTIADWKRELEIHIKKGYGEWDIMNNRVPPEDNPNILLIKNNGLNSGDSVIYFSDGKERTGTIIEDGGSFKLLDSKGNKNGIFGILNSPDSWIRKA